jgi:hypothetical protein
VQNVPVLLSTGRVNKRFSFKPQFTTILSKISKIPSWKLFLIGKNEENVTYFISIGNV